MPTSKIPPKKTKTPAVKKKAAGANTTPGKGKGRKKGDTNIETLGVKTTPGKKKFAASLAVNGDPTKALKDAGIKAKNPSKSAWNYKKSPDVVAIVNATRAQIRPLLPLGMEEIKQLLTEITCVSPLDLAEPDGTFDVNSIRARGLTRMVKKISQTETCDENGKITVHTHIEGYNRLEAIKTAALIHTDEENRELQAVQSIISLLRTYPDMRSPAQLPRVINGFAEKLNISSDRLMIAVRKFGGGQVIDVEAKEVKDK